MSIFKTFLTVDVKHINSALDISHCLIINVILLSLFMRILGYYPEIGYDGFKYAACLRSSLFWDIAQRIVVIAQRIVVIAQRIVVIAQRIVVIAQRIVVIAQRIVVIPCRPFGKTYRPNPQGLRNRRRKSFTLEDGTNRLFRNVGKELLLYAA